MTSPYPLSTSPPHWESRNGYIPPPRFQQLRAQDNQQHVLNQSLTPRFASPDLPSPGPSSRVVQQTVGPSLSPDMAHSRSPSFFSFNRSKQSANGQLSVQQSQRPVYMSSSNINTNTMPSQQYLTPSSNTFPPSSAAGSPRQLGQPPQNVAPAQYISPQQQQPIPGYATPQVSHQLPPQQDIQQPLLQQSTQPTPPASLSQHPQKPQPQPQQSTSPAPKPTHTSNGSQSTVGRSPSVKGDSQNNQASAPTPLHPEIRSVVQLTIAHAHKIYFSGPLVRRIERQGDGQKPHKDEGWTDVWAQLGGTTLSIWSMKEIQEASKQGKEVPPSYINVTDAFIQVLGSVTVPATPTTPSKRYTNVLTLNTAGSNLLLFSCPSTAALLSWAAALRLSAWEKSRLEEIYTAHLIRITLSARDIPTTLVKGKMEGYARVRIAGQTDWKRVWFVVQEGSEVGEHGAGSAVPQETVRKKRMSNLFSRDTNIPHSPIPTKSMITLFAGPKPKDRKKPLMTIYHVTQAFGVYPERPELINRSTLMKIEGTFGDDDIAGTLRTREGWILVMPELENGVGQAAEMLKWIVALHDAFELYGRPEAWTWDPRDPISLMFGYPVGPQKDNLFLEREIVENMDPRDDRTSVIRAEMKKLLQANLRPAVQAVKPNPRAITDSPPTLPPISGSVNRDNLPPVPQETQGPANSGPQIPPLSFGTNVIPNPPRDRPLTPITERSSIITHGRTLSIDSPSALNGGYSPQQSSPSAFNDQAQPGMAGFSGSGNSGPFPGRNTDSPAASASPTTTRPTSNTPQPNSPSTLSQIGRAMATSSSANTISTQFSTAYGTQPSSESFVDKSQTSIATTAPANSPRPQEITPLESHGPDVSPPTLTPTTSKPPVPLHSPAQMLASAPPKVNTSDQFGVHSESSTHAAPAANVEQQPLSRSENAVTQNQALQPPFSSNTERSSPRDDPNEFINEAGALYYMRESNSRANGASFQPQTEQSRGKRPERNAGDEEEEDDSSSNESNAPLSPVNNKVNMSISKAGQRLAESPGENNNSPHNQSSNFVNTHPSNTTPATGGTLINTATSPIGRLSPTRSGLGRKPSGARAQATIGRSYNRAESISSQTVTETDESMSKHRKQESSVSESAFDDSNGEALAALSYLDIVDPEPMPTSSATQNSPPLQQVEPLNIRSQDRGSAPSSQPNSTPSENAQYRSSFAPSNKAAERKLKAQAQQAAHHAATHKPGRANGKRRSKVAGAWESSEEEEEEEEEEDDDIDSDTQKPRGGLQSSSSQGHSLSASTNSLRPLQVLQGQTELNDQNDNQDGSQTPSHLRPTRNLPQIPGNRMTGDNFHHPQPQPIPRRMISDQYTSDSSRRTYYEDGTPIRTQAEYPQPGAARQTVWSQVLDPGHAPGRAPQPEQAPMKDTFVQLEPSETMTKAFTPQGLLSAGLQDKEDRSARRQEELARESGASLINVPNKPPPPQTGLLGAITAHERERKREGGVGAALTEREREKRLAEERQRRFDDHQRQQLDQMQQGGSMYGGQFGYNPMMGNPMMMGINPMMSMNPMMTGNGMNPLMAGVMGGMNPMMTGQVAYPGMMGGFNPHMFAAQQAAQAYQQAMMAFSVAGSQVGGEGGASGSQITPNMTGMNPTMSGMNPPMTNMAGFDPRMSMMGLPMMGMGMGTGAPMAPIGMQTTGMSNFDARSSPGLSNSGQGNANDLGLLPPQNLQFSSRNSSPASRGSPLARGGPETVDRGRPSRPTSPK